MLVPGLTHLISHSTWSASRFQQCFDVGIVNVLEPGLQLSMEDNWGRDANKISKGRQDSISHKYAGNRAWRRCIAWGMMDTSTERKTLHRINLGNGTALTFRNCCGAYGSVNLLIARLFAKSMSCHPDHTRYPISLCYSYHASTHHAICIILPLSITLYSIVSYFPNPLANPQALSSAFFNALPAPPR